MEVDDEKASSERASFLSTKGTDSGKTSGLRDVGGDDPSLSDGIVVVFLIIK